MFDIISIGDSTLDAFFEIDEAQVTCDINKENCVICFNYADKIPVKNFTRVPAAGNAANNAVGSARLGLKTAIYTILGKDEIGRDIEKTYETEGVDRKYIVWDDVHGSNVSVILSYKGERTIFIYHQQRIYQWPADFGPAKWIYYTSMGKEHYTLHKPLEDYVSRNSANLAFNPGTWQIKEGLETLKPIMALSKVFIVNREEAQTLVGQIHDIKELLEAVKSHCGGIVAITNGPEGSYAFDGQKFYKLGILESPVVERTGAGDAYATGLVAALFYGKSLTEAMVWGTVNAISVVQKIGPQEGLLKKAELEKIVSENPNFKAEEF